MWAWILSLMHVAKVFLALPVVVRSVGRLFGLDEGCVVIVSVLEILFLRCADVRSPPL